MRSEFAMMMKKTVFYVLAGLVCMCMPALAGAEVKPIIRDNMSVERSLRADFLGSVGNHLVGGAGWFVVPVLHDGFLPGVNDSFDVEVGGYVAWYFKSDASYVFIEPAAGVKWNFHVLNELTLYVGARTGVVVGLGADIFEPDGGGIVGLYWHLAEDVDLRLEAAYAHVGRAGAQVGVSFPF